VVRWPSNRRKKERKRKEKKSKKKKNKKKRRERDQKTHHKKRKRERKEKKKGKRLTFLTSLYGKTAVLSNPLISDRSTFPKRFSPLNLVAPTTLL
jgi:hypothetical protein